MKRWAITVVIAVAFYFLITIQNHPKGDAVEEHKGKALLPTKSKYELCMSSSECKALTEVAYYEARGEGDNGIVAVMSVVLNRMEHPTKRWPKNIKDVTRQKCEFSYRCDGSMESPLDFHSWEHIANIAYDVKSGKRERTLKGAYFYHNNKVRKQPAFAKEFPRVATIGNHVFYTCNTSYC